MEDEVKIVFPKERQSRIRTSRGKHWTTYQNDKKGKPKRTTMLMKYSLKHLIKMLLNDSQISINYLKIIEKTPWKKLEIFLKGNNLVITKANKSEATLILDIRYHISKADKQVWNNSLYQKLNEEPTKLTIEEVRTPQFYMKFINLICQDDIES